MISVLYVDDESALLEVTKNFMERSGGFAVDTAISAREAIEKLKAERYDALVADYLMPEMDGLALLKYLRPHCNGMPFILFTGNGGEEVAIEALNSGADFYVQKKGSPRTQVAELETKIRSAVARKQSELALRASEEEFRSLVEQLADTVFTVNEEGVVAYVSPSIRRFGYEPKDLVGRDFSMLVSAEDIPAVARQFADVRQGINSTSEFRMTERSGQVNRVRVSFCPRTDHGQFTGAGGLIADITGEDDNKEESRRSMNRDRQMSDLSGDGMAIIDPGTGLPVAFNDMACHQLGYSREEFAGLGVQDWEAGDAPQTIPGMIPEILRTGRAAFETRHRDHTGRSRDMAVSARVLEEGPEKKIGLILRDITDECRERGWEGIFDAAPVAQFTLSAEGNVTAINRAGAGMLGVPAQEITGMAFAGFVEPGEETRLIECLAETGRSGSVCSARFTLRPRGGRSVIVSLDGAAIRERDGGGLRIVLTLTDITGQEIREAGLKDQITAAGAIIAGARDGIVICTPDQRITGWNPAMEDITGIAATDALGQSLAGILPFLTGTGADAPARAGAGEIVATPDARYEFPATGKRGWARAIFSPLRTQAGEITGVIGVMQEITVRTKTLLRLRADQRLYAISAQVSATAAVLRELETLLAETCRIAIDGETVCMAWIGLFDHAAGILRPVAQAGAGKELPREGYPVAGADQVGCLACGAVRTGAPLISPDISTDPGAEPWRDVALRDGYRSEATVPFRLKGEVVGALTLCSGEPLAFSPENTEVLAHLGSTLSFALDLLDKKTLQRRAGKGGRGSWERTRFLAGGIESAAMPFAAVHADGSTGAVNAALCVLLGYTEEEVLARPFSSLLDPPENEGERFRQVLDTQKPERYESTARRKDGTPVPIEILLQAIPDETGGETCIGIFLTDITDKTQQADALEQDRLKYRTIVEETSAALVTASPEGRILSANPAACRLLGRTEAELSGGRGLAADGDPRFVELVRISGESGSATGELRLVRSDGTALDVEAGVTRFPGKDGRPALNLVFRDLTDAKNAEDTQVREREAALAFLDKLPVPARLSETGGAGTYFNKAWYAFTGRSPREEQDMGWMEGIHPDDREQYRVALASRTDESGPIESEYRLLHRTGEYRQVHEVCVPDARGGPLTCTCIDIHATRQAEEACRHEQALRRAVLETMTEAALLVGDRILEGNAAAARLFGCSVPDLAGQDLFARSPREQPDGRASDEAARQYLAAARAGTSQAFPWTFTGNVGPTREMQVTLAPVESGSGQQVLAVITDKTDLNRAIREIRRLSDFAAMNPHPVIEATRDHAITYANPAAAEVLSAVGLPVNPEVFLPADFDFIVLTLKQEPRKKAERVVQLKERSFNETICLSPGQDLVRIYAYDITDRVQAMEALAYANHKLGILTSITRHDIQNKLTGVIGYLDLLRGSLRDPQLLGFLDKAETSADAIRHHIEFTRDYESLGGTAPAWQEITPILAGIRSHFDAGTIAFEEPEPGFSVFADPMFAKVIYNLVDNSLRHGVHVRRIRLLATPGENGGCTLAYEDDGVGIPQDKKETIFERGFTTSSGPGKSSGLGLFLVRDILAITGITIKETGVPGSGSRFEMSIPPGKWKAGSA